MMDEMGYLEWLAEYKLGAMELHQAESREARGSAADSGGSIGGKGFCVWTVLDILRSNLYSFSDKALITSGKDRIEPWRCEGLER